MGDMLTVKQLRQRYGVTAKQIEHALSTRDIEPTQRIGNVRLFDDRAVKRIEATLRETGAMPVPAAVETVASELKQSRKQSHRRPKCLFGFRELQQ